MKFQGKCLYYSDDKGGQSTYYSGYNSTNPDNSADNYIMFGYYHPAWTVSYAGKLVTDDGDTDHTLARDSATVDDKSSFYQPADPTEPDGYTFEGWYTDENLTIKAVFPITITEDTVLYAKFTENIYTIDYHLNYTDATGAPADETFAWSDTLDLDMTSIRVGYTLSGWATTRTGEVLDTSKSFGEAIGNDAIELVNASTMVTPITRTSV